MTSPRIAAEPPAGWLRADIEKPTIAASSGASISTWTAWRSTADDAAGVAGCVATPIPGWVEDMRPAVEARTTSLAGASASKITGAPVDVRPGEAGIFALRAASDLGGPVIGHAKTFVGFDESRVFTCFATCAAKPFAAPAMGGELTAKPGTARRECERFVSDATLEGSLPPPQPGLALYAATWAVHHPRVVAAGGGALIVLLGLFAVVFRRRPRSTIGVA